VNNPLFDSEIKSAAQIPFTFGIVVAGGLKASRQIYRSAHFGRGHVEPAKK
jgi:hypothetical protein